MNILSNAYIFYVDVYFIQNFLIKIVVLYLSLYCNKLYFSIDTVKGIGKVVLASFFGTIVEIAGLLLGNSYNLFLVLVHLLEIPFMMCFVLRKERHQLGKVIIAGYFFLMVINSVLELLWNWFGESGNYAIFLIIACGITYAGVRILQKHSKMKKGIFPVEFICGEKKAYVSAFYDSGNQLIDPYTGKGVHIISNKLFKELLLQEEKKVCIPYQALGNVNGILDVYYIEKVRVYRTSKTIDLQKAPVGIAQDNLFEGKQYEVILNENIW